MDSFGPAGIKPGQRFNSKEKFELELLGYDFTNDTLLSDSCLMWVCIYYTPPKPRLPPEWGMDDSMAVIDCPR